MEFGQLLLFISTFFFVSITPGMCMTLAMSMGMTIGIRRTQWMMLGEVLGVALVAFTAAIGVAAIMLNYPHVFLIFKLLGAGYLAYIGIQLCRSRGKMAIPSTLDAPPSITRRALFFQGFITAIANPKGWAFMISLLPPFIDTQRALLPQLSLMLLIIACSEWTCMMVYAAGGKSLRALLNTRNNITLLNRIAGGLMLLVALWLVLA